LIHAVFEGSGVQALAGAVSSALFVPAMMMAKGIRRQNLAIRLLEAALSRAETAQEAAQAIRSAFTEVFVAQGKQLVS
jgi:hypothetical protein